jgi:hypothetical protein
MLNIFLDLPSMFSNGAGEETRKKEKDSDRSEDRSQKTGVRISKNFQNTAERQ